LDIPYRRYDIVDHLGSIGIPNPAGTIYVRDNEDENIGIKLFSETDIGNKLLLLFSENDTLSTVNTVCDVVNSLDYQKREAVEDALKCGQFNSASELMHAVKK
jgi:hypothetical protein